MAGLDRDVRKISQHSVHLVVLALWVVQVGSCELIGSVITEKVFVEVESKEVRMVPRGCVKEDTNVQVGKFVITHGHNRGGEVGLLGVRVLGRFGALEATEGLLNRGNQLFMVHVSSSGDDHVLPDVVPAMEVSHLLCCDIDHILSNSWHWLSDIVVSERSIVCSLEYHFSWILLINSVAVNGIPLCFYLSGIVQGISK